ncbi:sterol desaturase family protein [Penaeicola halotolerans]|uniref:sterol desaturase family protein n=1 Tax=Penaeicola halotolerans TaxID=2793196 RepID=UPI001CF89671|nr:sterol desaturase family protein [Penaeicola halotolerans]
MNIIYLTAGFVFMEIFSWAFHKYIMHGVLWNIHKTHHGHSKGGYFELNDIFSLIFGSTAVVLIILGSIDGFDWRFWVGAGITVYGFSYFILHDMLIHRRVKVFDRPRGKFLNGIAKAHRDHHKSNKKDGAVSFGLFLVPKKYFSKD